MSATERTASIQRRAVAQQQGNKVYTFTVDIEAQVRTEELVDYRAERSPLCCRSLLVDRRTGAQEQPGRIFGRPVFYVHSILIVQGNLANTYSLLGRDEEALSMRREVYSGRVKLDGNQHEDTLRAALNYAVSLIEQQRFEEAKSVLCKMIPVARRVLDGDEQARDGDEQVLEGG